MARKAPAIEAIAPRNAIASIADALLGDCSDHYIEQGIYASKDGEDNIVNPEGLEDCFYVNAYSLPNYVRRVELYYTTETDVTEIIKNDSLSDTDSISVSYENDAYRNDEKT